MTPDRNDQTPLEDAENGMLGDSASVDTSVLGIIGSATAQVNVALPADAEEADDDDDIIGDEMPYVTEPASRDDVPTIDTADVFVIEIEGAEAVADHVMLDDIEDDERVEDGLAREPAVEATTEASDVEVLDSLDADAADADAADADEVEAPAHPEPDVVAAPVSTTGSVPATRWEAQHPDSPERRARARAAERSPARTEVALSSKRLGEFEASRESADLLTADRLLDPHQVVRPEPEGAWQHFVYSLSGKRINLGDGKRARARKALDRRIAAPLAGGARFVPVVSRKGGVGKTTITTLLGMALADARDDRIIAVDANPDRGTLADRISKANGKTVRDLVRTRGEVSGYNDISTLVARDETRLDVIASDSDPRVSEAFSDRDYHDVAALAAHYYSIVLTDTGTGIVHSVMGATLELADQIVVVAGLSVDEARLASETLTWLETNGYSEQVRNAVVVLNTARPGAPLVRADELERHFRTRARAVVHMPYDPHIAAGSAISFRELQTATREAARELAAAVVEGIRSSASAA